MTHTQDEFSSKYKGKNTSALTPSKPSQQPQQQEQSQTHTLKCPICDKTQPVPVDSGVKALQSNLVLKNLANEARQQLHAKHTNPVCGRCEETPAVSGCVTCESELCADCFDIMHKGKLKSHAAVSVVELHQKHKNKSFTCSVHKGKPLELYCIKDEKMMCYLCLQAGAHRNHECETLEDAVSRLKVESDGSIQKLKSVVQKMEVFAGDLRKDKVTMEQVCALCFLFCCFVVLLFCCFNLCFWFLFFVFCVFVFLCFCFLCFVLCTNHATNCS